MGAEILASVYAADLAALISGRLHLLANLGSHIVYLLLRVPIFCTARLSPFVSLRTTAYVRRFLQFVMATKVVKLNMYYGFLDRSISPIPSLSTIAIHAIFDLLMSVLNQGRIPTDLFFRPLS